MLWIANFRSENWQYQFVVFYILLGSFFSVLDIIVFPDGAARFGRFSSAYRITAFTFFGYIADCASVVFVGFYNHVSLSFELFWVAPAWLVRRN